MTRLVRQHSRCLRQQQLKYHTETNRASATVAALEGLVTCTTGRVRCTTGGENPEQYDLRESELSHAIQEWSLPHCHGLVQYSQTQRGNGTPCAQAVLQPFYWEYPVSFADSGPCLPLCPSCSIRSAYVMFPRLWCLHLHQF